MPVLASTKKPLNELRKMSRAFVLKAGLSLLLLTPTAFLQAQGPAGGPPGGPGAAMPQSPGEVKGVVMDGEANTAIARASIAVRTAQGQVLVTGTVAKDDGTFRVQGLRPGTYYLRVTSLGYAPISSVAFTITPASLVSTIGTIKLNKAAVSLSNVEV